ncbi:hypothetical protein [Dyella lutea]|uniref:Uncharacterized protein n=1 Tax=Dyella lutea TaxID=2950441 RepID=A0ABT1F6B2_9GAMM|nr:hypothetical protein [Dyella lutea]MCP1372923.1 hypothetical protein [Dyella lutea]
MKRLRVRDNEPLLERPPYLAFAATALARQGAQFGEITGNRGAVLVGQAVPAPAAMPTTGHVLIRQPILARPGGRRQALEVTVADLSSVLADSGAVERVFDC